MAALTMFSLTACSNDDSNSSNTPNPDPILEPAVFAQGADVSWLTEMETSGKKFRNASGNEQECMALLRSIGVNAVRLRVWVNPTDGWCGKQDVLVKAKRAKELGERIMIDFHYSDWWADPGKQNIPAAWEEFKDNIAKMKEAVAEHTTDVLSTLKENGIDVEWIQIGNETTTGMLWPLGQAEGTNFKGYIALNNAGYDAAKKVYPDAKCIVHIDRGQELSHLTWMFDGLKNGGARWDVIGLSFYPTDSDWQATSQACLNNISTLAARYGRKVMVCEIGMAWDSSNAAAMMRKMVDGCKAKPECLGIFYWEPEAYGNWNGYSMGAFDNDGKPTAALDAFKSATQAAQ